MSMMLFEAVKHQLITPLAMIEGAGYPADSGNADAGLFGDLPVGYALFQKGDNPPAVSHITELLGGAEIV